MINIDNVIIHVLYNLTQLDIDAAKACEQAIKQVDDTDIYHRLIEFRDDHLRHVEELTLCLIKLGGSLSKSTQDLPGFITKGFTAIRSFSGTCGALKTMQINEDLTNQYYYNALNKHNLPDDIKALIEKNYSDERRHLEYINENANRICQLEDS